MDGRELNEFVKRIETAYRDDHDLWKVRLRFIEAANVRATILEHKIGMFCDKCLAPDFRRYCCKEHREYYNKIVHAFYFVQKPFNDIKDCSICNKPLISNSKILTKCECTSIDHIKPVASSGLEFDRENLQWAHLSCNIKKSGGKVFDKREAEAKIQRRLSLFVPKSSVC